MLNDLKRIYWKCREQWHQNCSTAESEPLANQTQIATGRNISVSQGTVLEHELGLLKELVTRSSSWEGPIVEIGTLFGFTTTNIALWKASDKRIITVDNYSWNPWNLSEDTHFELTERILYFLIQTGHVTQLRLDKNEFFRSYTGQPPALFFLDAIHEYEPTLEDIIWARRLGAKIICGHDYSEEFPGVQRAVDEAGGPAQLHGSLWVL